MKGEREGRMERIVKPVAATGPAQAGSALRTGPLSKLALISPPPAGPHLLVPTLASVAAASNLPPPPATAYDSALTLAAMGFHEAATEALREVTARAPGHPAAWRKLAELLRLAGKDAEARSADAAAERTRESASKWPRPTDDRTPEQFEKAEQRLRDTLGTAARPQQMTRLRDLLMRNSVAVAAMRLLAELEREDGDEVTAGCLLQRALDLAPGYTGARTDFARLLMDRQSYMRALAETRILIASAPRNMMFRAMHANALRYVGDFAAAIAMIEGMLEDDPRNPQFLCVYAQALHFAGRRDESVAAYRACLDIAPSLGEAYWGLAELRGNFLTANDIAAMRAHLQGGNLELASRTLMQYALGQALERAGDFAGSFAAYEAGADLFRNMAARAGNAHDATAGTEQLRRRRAVFAAPNPAPRAADASASPAATPIFIVGMPRAGSTLVEQILASHSMVEATLELPVLAEITRDLTLSRAMVTTDAYPECVAGLTRSELAALGARYLELAGPYRKTGRPYFIDKRPSNWLEAGLISMILPHARIIDIRREPMAACFAMYKQILPGEASFSYELAELGRHYNEYVDMMRHYETVLPGRIHFLQYELLVEDTETEIRRLLEYCGLPFEERCLRFWETDRTVATPSAEQVRRPIFRDALQHWRNYEQFLAPLRVALGSAGNA